MMQRIVLGKMGQVDLVKFVKKVYELSVPSGLGFLHAKPGGLVDEEAHRLISETQDVVIDMDYVKGRCCKMYVRKESNGDLVIPASWYDHTDEDLKKLLDCMGVKADNAPEEHAMACNCVECRIKQGKDPNIDDVTGLRIPRG